MAARTNPTVVQQFLGENYDGTTILTRFITLANIVTSRVSTCATARGTTLSADELENLESLLACHFYMMADKAYQSRTTADANATFQGQTGMELDSTDYGQSAKLLEKTLGIVGCLSGTTAQMTWLGKPKSEQTKYANRD